MTYFEWTSAIEIGHAQIDEQHRQLLVLGEAVVDPLIRSADHEAGATHLRALIAFAREHFAFEEDLMRSAGYPEADQHAKHHATLLKELDTYFNRLQRGDNSNPVGLVSFLWNWIVLHVDSTDRELVVWLDARGTDGR